MARFRRKRSGFRRSSRRRSTFRSSRGSSFSLKRRRRSKGGSNGGSLTGLLVGAAAYGAGREFVSDKLRPITSKIPVAGEYADEIGMGLLSYFVAKGKIPLVNKIPYSREIGRAGLTIEAARVGAGLASGLMPSMSSTASSGQYL